MPFVNKYTIFETVLFINEACYFTGAIVVK